MGSKQSRWKTCSKHTVKIFGLAIGRLFVEETFDEEAKEHVSILPHCLKILKCGRPLQSKSIFYSKDTLREVYTALYEIR